MRVVAIKNGYIHGEYKRIGASFECTKEEFSEIWMSEDIKDIPKPLDNSNAKKAEDVKHIPFETVDVIQERDKKKAKAKKESKPKTKKAE